MWTLWQLIPIPSPHAKTLFAAWTTAGLTVTTLGAIGFFLTVLPELVYTAVQVWVVVTGRSQTALGHGQDAV